MLNSIQILRALAAWLVVGHHYMQLFYSFELTGAFPEAFQHFGAIGVDLFFVISGFVIYGSTVSKPTSPKAFALNRIARIAPAYWLFTSITAIATIAMPGSIPLTSFEPIFFIKSLFFIPGQNPSGVGLYPLITVGWTLNYEASFYAVFFMTLFVPFAYRFITLFAGIALMQTLASNASGALAFYGNAIVWEFLLGVALSIFYQRGWLSRITTPVAFFLALASLVAIIYFGPVSHNPMESGIPCALILCAAISQERFFPKHSMISRLGDWSYSTYLCHVLVICLAIKLNDSHTITPPLIALGACALILLTSYISFSFIEKPASKIARKLQSKPAPKSA